MSKRWTTWTGLLLWIVSMALAAGYVILGQIHGESDDQLVTVFVLAIITSMATAGGILAAHRPGNPIGWLFLLAALCNGMAVLGPEYGLYVAETSPGRPTWATFLFWLGAWTYIPVFMLPLTFGILLFPTGNLPSSRWRPFAWFSAAWIALWIFAEMFSAGSLDPEPDGAYAQVTNPVGIKSLDGLLDVVLSSGEIIPLLLVAGAVGSMFARLRSASSVEGQQIKWFAYAATIALLGALIEVLLVLGQVANAYDETAGSFVTLFGIALLPIAIGIAILRHNLYDIDRLINRTLVYGLLTALLLISFAGGVLLFQFLLSPFTGGNDLAVAGSTLLTLALFQPVRARLQIFVDRRFYRQKYDAQLTLQTFGLTARDAVDVDQIVGNLAQVVSATMQPEHISVWLSTATSRGDRQ